MARSRCIGGAAVFVLAFVAIEVAAGVDRRGVVAHTGRHRASAAPPAQRPDGPQVAGAGHAQAATSSPLIGDFNGDRRDDVVWYGPGDAADHLWLGRADRLFHGIAIAVAGTYQPLIGDFNGDRRDDVLWYGPGGAADVLWYGAGHGFTLGPRTVVGGSYWPLVGDYNGDGRDDLFWYGPGGAADVLWYGAARGFAFGGAPAVGAAYAALVGDYNGDGRDDLFWYGRGAQRDALWYGTPTGFVSARPVTAAGDYRPLVGDFNGDQRDDILWYGGGGQGDALWYGTLDRFVTGPPITVAGAYEPFVSDFGNDGRDDIFWYAAGPLADAVWHGRPIGFAGANHVVGGRYRPHAGDFDGNGRDDVLWHGPGVAADHVWYGEGASFHAWAATLDPEAEVAPPLRGSAASRPLHHAVVAHALGTIGGWGYTNSREAFLHHYSQGFRVFEVDLVRLADGTVFAAHDGLEAHYGLKISFRSATRAHLAGAKYRGRYTPLDGPGLVALLRQHPDAYLILDSKWESVANFASLVHAAGRDPRVVERIVPQVAYEGELDGMRRIWPLRNYVLALYRTQWLHAMDDPQAVEFVRSNRVPAVLMWWRQRNPHLSLSDNSAQHRRYSEPFRRALHAAGAAVYVHALDRQADTSRFLQSGVGAVVNHPYPG
ncbi:MAG TPA: FG-GAP-like repeat-containing protein [Acidimicrobiales bacterium]|nr:FG-GAP-like repeat-containing protein [Acidimicrobiales bacterium]